MKVYDDTPLTAQRYVIELDRNESYELIFYLAEARRKSNIIFELCDRLEEARGDFRLNPREPKR